MSSPGPSLRKVARPLCFGVYEYHPDTLELKRAGQPVRLQELPARMLAALLRNPGELVTREQLQAELWPSNTYVQFDAGLNTAMNKLRMALRDSAENPRFIETVPRTGYRFIAPVRRLDARQAAPLQPVEMPLPEAPREAVVKPPAEPEPVEKPHPRRGRRWLWAGIALAGAAAVLFLLLPRARFGGSGPTVRFTIDLPAGQQFQFYAGRQVAISPDGATLAWIAATGGVRQIYVRKLAESAFATLAGTARASSLCFSPAGDWIAYLTQGGDLRRASADGRWNLRVVNLGSQSTDGALVWGSDGWIYFSAVDYPPSKDRDSRRMFRVRAEGGSPQALLPDPQPTGAWYPLQLLPRGLLYTIDYAPSDTAVDYLPFADRKVRQLLGHASGARYLPTGHLIFDRSGNLMAVPFDPGAMEVKGKPVMVAPDVAPDRYAGLQMDISRTGTLIYFRGTIVREREPVWVDAEGRESPALPAGRYRLLDISPDGKSLLVVRYDAGDHWTMYTYRFDDRTWKAIVSDDSPGVGAVWGPDGRSIAIAGRYQGELFDTLYLKSLDTTGGERPLVPGAYDGKYPQSWSRAANAIAYTEGYHEKTKRDVYVLPLTPGSQPQCIACTLEDDVLPTFSPDGRWIAYTSGGPSQIYVQRYPGPIQPIRISPDGGYNSLWAPSGREIYYRKGSEMWAVSFDPGTGKAGKARKVFAGRYDLGGAWNRDMLMAPDGRFLMLKMQDDPPDYRRIQVVVNWFRELEQVAPR
jgi:DNA-binding winged helix-turn-helix (wHTH) protein/Tol biopolymer transport system component